MYPDTEGELEGEVEIYRCTPVSFNVVSTTPPVD